MDPFSWLDAVFSGGGSEGSSTQGSAPVNQGFSPMAGWMVSQAFAGTGPVGQYLGMLYSSPGTGIPEVDWGTDSAGDVDRGDYLDFTGGMQIPLAAVAPAGATPTTRRRRKAQSIEHSRSWIGGIPSQPRCAHRLTRCLSSGPRRSSLPVATGSRGICRRSGPTPALDRRIRFGGSRRHRRVHRVRVARPFANRCPETPQAWRRNSRDRSSTRWTAGRTSTST